MGKPQFIHLKVYGLAESLADEIWDLVVAWDRFAQDTVGKQLVRAADSVGANIAEGAGRGSFKDNRRFVRTARSSLNETHHFLRRAYRRRLLTAGQIERLRALLEELGPKLNAYLRSIGSPRGSGGGSQRTTDN